MIQDSIAEIQTFFERYREAFSNQDLEAFTACFSEPFSLSSATYLVEFASIENVRKNLAALLERYQLYGVKQATIKSLQTREYSSGHAIVDLTWQMEDRTGQTLLCFDTTYILKRLQGCWKIAFVIAHNEHQRFQETDIPHPES